MSVDLRCRHDREVKERAATLFTSGRGPESIARAPRHREKQAATTRALRHSDTTTCALCPM